METSTLSDNGVPPSVECPEGDKGLGGINAEPSTLSNIGVPHSLG